MQVHILPKHPHIHTTTHLRGVTAASGVSNKPAFQRRTLLHYQVNNWRGSVFSRITKQILFFNIHSSSWSQFNCSLTVISQWTVELAIYSVRFLEPFFRTRSPPFTMLWNVRCTEIFTDSYMANYQQDERHQGSKIKQTYSHFFMAWQLSWTCASSMAFLDQTQPHYNR